MSNTRGNSQAKILDYIQRSIKEVGYPPSVREICNATGLKSTSTVHGHLLRLQKKGLLNRDAMKPRAITVPSAHGPDTPDMETVHVPIVGCVTAGTPILATENIEDYVPLPQSLLGDGEHYVLRVRGESMVEAGILNGDYVVVKKQPTAYNGEIVVAMIGDEATVKRYYKENGMFRLQPENRSMQPIFTTELTILGKVVSVYRVY
ncbi:MAG: transcriptional repressor LexA [Candidatus Limiplasma sp.]|nr:transcriptional repressor LexA [Candidatus Limiplasma sp.]